MSELKTQVKRRLLDLVFLAAAGAVAIGAFYGYVMVRNHNLLDQALIQAIQASQPEAPVEVPE